MTDAPDPSAALTDAMRTIAELEHALMSRQQIGEAVGIVMERYKLDQQAAFNYLVRVSSHSNVKLRDVAAEIVAETSVRSAE